MNEFGHCEYLHRSQEMSLLEWDFVIFWFILVGVGIGLYLFGKYLEYFLVRDEGVDDDD